MAPTTRYGDDVVNFLKSKQFEELIASIVRKEVNSLQSIITELRSEIQILKDSNIDLIRLLDNKNKITHDQSDVLKSLPRKDRSVSFAVEKPKAATFSFANVLARNNSKQKTIDLTESISQSERQISSNANISDVTGVNDEIKDSGWSVVTKKRKFKQLDAIQGSNKNSSSIKGVASYSHLHVYRLDPTLKPEQIVSYLESQDVIGSKCEQLNSKFPEIYSSFKVSVPEKYLNEVMKPEKWPENVRVNRFFERLVRLPKET